MFYIFPLRGRVSSCLHSADEEIVQEKVSALFRSGSESVIELDPEMNSTSSYWS